LETTFSSLILSSRKSIRILYQADGNSPEKIGSTEAPVAATMDAGSVLIFDDRILHRGGHNRAFCDRDVAFFSYRNLELLAFYRDRYITCLGGLTMQMYGKFEGFPLNSALFGLVI